MVYVINLRDSESSNEGWKNNDAKGKGHKFLKLVLVKVLLSWFQKKVVPLQNIFSHYMPIVANLVQLEKLWSTLFWYKLCRFSRGMNRGPWALPYLRLAFWHFLKVTRRTPRFPDLVIKRNDGLWERVLVRKKVKDARESRARAY